MLAPVKGSATTRGHNVQDRLEWCLLCNSPIIGIPEISQVPVKKPSVRGLLLLIWTLDSSGFFKVIKNSFLPLEVALYKRIII